LSSENISKDNPSFLKDGLIKIHEADGRLGYASDGPYDVIHVGAASQGIPKELLDQLKCNGLMIIPASESTPFKQQFLLLRKDENGNISKKHMMDVIYVPLTSKENQLANAL
jgi:protein-L-isoaspartate(D-aspartate) O-methyltransferase